MIYQNRILFTTAPNNKAIKLEYLQLTVKIPFTNARYVLINISDDIPYVFKNIKS